MSKTENLSVRELTLPPAGEWSAPAEGWLVCRLGLGHGYWRHSGTAVELAPGDLLVTPPRTEGTLLASRLGEVMLSWAVVRPENLPGLFTFAEQQSLDVASRSAAPRRHAADHPSAREAGAVFADTASSAVLRRCRLLSLFVEILAAELSRPVAAVPAPTDARARLQGWLAHFPEAELVERSVEEFARELGCSARHLSRLFHDMVGTSFREKQTELRLLKARELLAGSDAKVIHVALESGYRHLGLFNALFKRRFGMTPTNWRRQNEPASGPRRRPAPVARPLAAAMALLALLAIGAQALAADAPATAPAIAPAAASASRTNAPTGPTFAIRRYDLQGNTLLPAEVVDTIVADFLGEKADFDTIRAALSALQLAYRGRGFATVSLSLPPQKLTDGVVTVKVTEGRLVEINVTGNRWFSAENVRRSLPGLTTNGFLNSKLFQAELDIANGNRDRQIYPQIQPGPEPGTSALLLKVKDQFPLHGRFELNNQATPGTPELRGSASAQYNNLWQREHSFGLQYGFSMQQFKEADTGWNIFDRPAIANYSTFYRMPVSAPKSLPAQVEAEPQRFGYDETSRQFRLPPASGRSELNFFASRSTTDTGVKNTPLSLLNPDPVTGKAPDIALYKGESGQDLSTTESTGFRWTQPLADLKGIRSTLSLGADLKNYHLSSHNTNNFTVESTYVNPSTGELIHNVNASAAPQPTRSRRVTYLPLAARWDGSRSAKTGSTSFGAGANVNFAGGPFSDRGEFSDASGNAKTSGTYVTAQASATRDQRIHEDWTVLLRADGQWANEPLISNEQFGIGGTGGVRGYQEGERYGDTGWRLALEPRTPWVDIGMVDGSVPMRIRASVFMDYGQSYSSGAPKGAESVVQLWGAGLGFNGVIGTMFDFRLGVAWALHSTPLSRPGDLQIYFGVGAQF